MIMLNSFSTLLLGTIAPSLHSDCDKPFVSGFYFMKKEIWKFIPNTNSKYEVSNFGRIRSWASKGTKKNHKRSVPFLLKLQINTNGYPGLLINFSELNVKKSIRVHRWVAILFIPNPNNYPNVLHKDDNKLNSHYSNLEWGTSTKNNQDAFKRGIIIPAKGVARKKSNLTEKDVRDIFKSKKTNRELSKKYKVNHTCISDIKSGRSWNHITLLPCTRKIRPKFSKDIQFK